MKSTILWLLLSVFAIVFVCAKTEHSSLVIDLPDLPSQPPFKHYSGYFNIAGGKRLHYWFVESQGKPTEDPVLLWLSPGPGCSAMSALLSEHGPFRVNDDTTLSYNNNSWNLNANVIYLDSPAYVGYSFSDNGQFANNDNKLAADNHAALLAFYEEFTEFSGNWLFIGGSGYGGLQAILLAQIIVGSNSSVELKGVAVGNPSLDSNISVNSAVYYAYYHGIIDESLPMVIGMRFPTEPSASQLVASLWKLLQADCCPDDVCDFTQATNAKCRTDLEVFRNTVYGKGINLYSVSSDCSGGVPPHVSLQWPEANGVGYTRLTCVNQTAEEDYLYHGSVREALHISADAPRWRPCAFNVTQDFNKTITSVTHLISSLSSFIRILIYSGLEDMMYNFLAPEWAIGSLNLHVSVVSRPWLYNNQVAGYIKEWVDTVSVATVRGAGHFVARSQPAAAYEMISSFLRGVPIG